MHLSKLTLTLLFLGGAALLAGLTFKLNHLLGAETLFNIGSFALVFGLLSAVGDVWRRSKP
jgi:membrane protein implicated in regulation of membrane protease activity